MPYPRFRYPILWALTVLFFLPLNTMARELEVPGDAETIQAAVDMAFNGDVVVLVDALYSGPGNRDVDFMGKILTITSQGGNALNCIVDATGGRGFLFRSGESTTSKLIGVTVTNGYGIDGGAIYISDASPWIVDCIFTGNATGGSGGAIYCMDSNAIISNCVFESNTADGGGGVHCSRSSTSRRPSILNCLFRNNVADFGAGVEVRNGCAARIEYSTFYDNVANGGGGGVGSDNGPFRMAFCTMSGNSGGIFGGGGIAGNFPSGTRVENTLIVNSTDGGAVYQWDNNFITFDCCNIFGNVGGDWVGPIADQLPGLDNISEDPQFCSSTPDADEYWGLQIDSPCSPDQSACGQIGAWGPDCGATGVRHLDWGSFKALYR